MYKLLIALSILSFMGCKPSQPKEIPVIPSVKVLSYTVVDGMKRIQEILNQKDTSKNQKICNLAADSLVGDILEDFWMKSPSDPNRSDIDYELTEVKKFYDKCKKQYK